MTIVGPRNANINWKYPGLEAEFDNEMVFTYPSEIGAGTWPIDFMAGVVDFDGSNGIQLFCPCSDLEVAVIEFDETIKYCCASFSGFVQDQDGVELEIDGSFKAFLNV